MMIRLDGVSKFYSNTDKRQRSVDPVHFLLVDTTWEDSSDMLERKYVALENEYGLMPYDDLGIIRIINP